MASVRMSNNLRTQLLSTAMRNFKTAKPDPELLGSDKIKLQNVAKNCMTLQAVKKVALMDDPALKLILEKSNRKSIGLRGGLFKDNKYSTIKFISGEAFNSRRSYQTDSSVSAFEPLKFTLDAAITVKTFNEDEIDLIEPTYYNGDALVVCIEDLLPDDLATVTTINDAHRKRCKTHSIEKTDYHTTLQALLDKTNTVGQFLEAWPGGEYLLPPAVISKLNTKVTRQQTAKKVKEEINFDAAACNNIALTAKLIGG